MTDHHASGLETMNLNGPLKAAGVLLAFVLLLTAASRITGLGQWRAVDAEPVAQVALVFTDKPGGDVVVSNAETGEVMRTFEAGRYGFLRAAVRAVAHERKMRDLPKDGAFILLRTAEGVLVLTDPLTGKRMRLKGFGDGNVTEFADLLAMGEA